MTRTGQQAPRETPEPAAAPGPDELLTLLTEQLELYRRLRDMARQQRELVSGENPGALLSLLGQRQELIAELARLDVRVGPIRRDWDRIGPELPSQPRQQATDMFKESRAILEDIIAADQEDTEALKTRQATVQESLRAIDAARQAHGAYAPAPTSTSRYLDETDHQP